MNGIVDALDEVRSSLLDVVRVEEPAGWSDDELLAATAAIEAVGRVIDAHRVACAGEVGERSRVELGGERLSVRRGCRSAAELLERVTQVSGAESRRRIALGTATRPRRGLTGDPLPARFPAVSAALADGELGADAAGTIVRELERTRRVADPADLRAAERELVAAAVASGDAAPVRCTADELRVQAQIWAAFLDQDGPEPDDERAMRRRGFRLGRARDGLIPVTGELLPEVAAGLRRLFDAHLAPRSGGGFMTAEERADVERNGEQRTADQQRHDVMAAIIATAARSGSVRAADLETGHGVAHADGVEIPVSIRAARQLMCTGGTQQVTFDGGRIVRLGSPERCFTPHQPGDHAPRWWMPHPGVQCARIVVRDPPRHPRRRRRPHPP
ncbi:hypothetical protein ASE14_15520 [Agromyces sp. Root81]|uniref:DUF222 domain-containing protein n=1 Tax=Agromyces sp. Root81 TaxID=1736601 RepID=UPI0006FD0D95|nr:DUF222 domain-containing protein [Agromyces sp. Root81]KRC59182.1 hypothetical protein ASE14_15520 [Agromyces sp. Root81]